MTRDRAYWEDAFKSFYISNNFGKYDEAFDAFVKEYPDFAEVRVEFGVEYVRASMTKRLKAQFDEGDRKESEGIPTPEHLRQTFLPFAIAVLLLSPSVNAADGRGRVSTLDATPKQHRQHHRELKNYHSRGHAYRQAAEEKWSAFMERIKPLFGEIDHPENLPFAKLVQILKDRSGENENDIAKAASLLLGAS